ncbi:alpha/beta hydrolase [Cyanobacterium aponinum UTEX 3221]|uniref:alpha/beta hydrolase n=1 Tax=Cyanobacterium aponinum TaxID=379064 RepID=UPI002B4BA3D1|nr:alpha/beta hydrolase [Cyanobacterium aponinum]WRL40090.1 alpha/beta hydrolase [Cyanobacterium aponinum UTEX 3221]
MKIFTKIKHYQQKFFLISILISLFTCLFSKSAESAEKINFVYGSLSFSVAIESLETFAKTGELKEDLEPYASQLDQKTLFEVRLFLNKSFQFPQASLYRISRTSLAQDLIKQLGKVISSHSQRNGFYAIRGAILTTAGNQESWNLIDVLKTFPTQEVYVNLELLAQLKDEIFAYQSYGDAVTKAIDNVAEKNSHNIPLSQLDNLPDLAKKGQYNVIKKTVILERNQVRMTKEGFVSQYNFPVDFYLPDDATHTFPLVLISHGFGSVRENFTSLAQHLASYGFIVAIPQHIGSDLQYRQELLKGTLSSALSPMEYLARPADLSYIIDYLESFQEDNTLWQKRANLSQIGVIGDSLGGTTALQIAGAPLNINRLQTECSSDKVIINIALILQCQASYLPPAQYQVADSRVKAVIATHPLVSSIFASEGLSKIKIPTMITAGSQDIITPFVIEQIHPFLWLQNIPKYLIFFQPGTHFSSTQPSPEFTLDSLPEFLLGKNRNISSEYFQGIAVAFLEVYLKNNQDYLVYLSSDYGKFRENNSLQVKQTNQLSVNDLKDAYGGDLPFAIETSLVVTPSWENQNLSILEEIKKTGVLKIAYPQNNEPLGYINQDGEWSGFCSFLGHSLADYLESNFDFDFEIKLVSIPSDSDNLFNLITTNQVHLECGQIISNNINKIVFSIPFMVIGNQFLVPQRDAQNFNLSKLNSLNIGSIYNIANEKFLDENYPQASKVYYNSFENVLTDLENNKIDVFLGNSLLLNSKISEISNQNKYKINPKFILNCDYYGLSLPSFDSQWIDIINGFLTKNTLSQNYFNQEANSLLLEQLNYCLNFQKDP